MDGFSRSYCTLFPAHIQYNVVIELGDLLPFQTTITATVVVDLCPLLGSLVPRFRSIACCFSVTHGTAIHHDCFVLPSHLKLQISVYNHGTYNVVEHCGDEWWTGEWKARQWEKGKMLKMQGKSVERKMTKLVQERGWEVNPFPLFPFNLFFFIICLRTASLPSPCSFLSVACTGNPLGSSSQPVSWSLPPEQHMIFHDYCYCLCPSSCCLQARCVVDAQQGERRKLGREKQERAELELSINEDIS